MIYPLPPYLTILAYFYGKISERECEEMLELWHKKHDQPKEGAEREQKYDI